MIGEVRNCARVECKREYTKITHNQKYCTNACCKIETNRKLMENYHEKVAIKNGKKRACRSCGISLSRYNENRICGSCETAKRNAHVGEAAQLISTVAWL